MGIGNLISKSLRAVAGVATGGLSEAVLSIVDEVVGDDMPPDQRARLKEKAMDLEHQRQMAAQQAANDAEKNVTERAKELEGTAQDLMALPIVGRVIIFLRGCQRPLWGFFTMFLVYKWMTGGLQPASENLVVADEQMGVMLIVINILVLGFLFGERTVKNLTPLIMQVFGNRQSNK